ncbi:MAG: thermonuclease family protein [Microscillaceae bacterium]|nr:thermonuclease family protein [Microscillaceae bacterium]
MEWNFLNVTLFALIGVSLILYLISTQRFEQARVLEVLDGDSIIVATERYKKGVKVRLGGIDAPEKGTRIFEKNEKFARQASRFVEERLPPNTKIYLEYDHQKWDEYGRLLAYIYITKSGKSLNAEMIRNGFATFKAHRRNKKYEKLFERLESQAKKYRLGLWQYH